MTILSKNLINFNPKKNFFYIVYFLTFLLIYLRTEILFGSDVIAPFTDDFYYYLVIAKNFIELGFPTFDKINLTNGFQPLWFLFIVLLTYIFGDGVIFNSVIFLAIGSLSLLVFFESKNYLIKQGYSEDASLFIGSFISFLTLFFSKGGMEIALVNYFIILSLSFLNKNSLIFCVVLFLTLLSRLDAIWIIMFLLLNYVVINYKKNLFGLLLFPLLTLSYIILNYLIFGSFIPDSGVAKSLNKTLTFNPETFNFLYIKDSYGYKFISILFLLNTASILLLFFKVKRESYIFIFSFIIFFITHSLRSSWKLWDWHFYYFSFSTPFILYEFLKIFKNYFRYFYYCTGIFFVVTFSFLLFKDYNLSNDHILNLSKKISHHYKNQNNYNIFAMGDMAGKVSFLLKKPVIQLEGLVSGNVILEIIDKQKSLCDIFKKFNVDIYLTNTVVKNNLNFEVYEPAQAGKNGKKISAFISVEPEKIFNSGNLNIYSFNVKKDNGCLNDK
jgi:hypothetical protein